MTPRPALPLRGTAALADGWPDVVGMVLSVLCAVHCVATLLFVSVLTTLGVAGIADPRVERVMLGGALVVGTVALGYGALAHRRWAPLLPFALGVVALLVVRPRVPEESPLEVAAVLCGAAGIVGAHALSYRRRRACQVVPLEARPRG